MMISNLTDVQNSVTLSRRAKIKQKRLKRRKRLFLFIFVAILISVLYLIKISYTNKQLSSSDTALKHHMLSGSKSSLSRIDNSELVFSHEDKSVYKVSGINKSDEFKIFEVGLKKDNSLWNLDYLKNLN